MREPRVRLQSHSTGELPEQATFRDLGLPRSERKRMRGDSCLSSSTASVAKSERHIVSPTSNALYIHTYIVEEAERSKMSGLESECRDARARGSGDVCCLDLQA